VRAYSIIGDVLGWSTNSERDNTSKKDSNGNVKFLKSGGKMKKLLMILLILVFTASMSVIGIGCSSGAAEVADETADETVEAADEAADETVEAEDEAVVEGDVVAEDGKHFEGITVYFFTGGDPGGTFTELVHKGAEDAARDLGIDLHVVYSGWLTEKMVEQLREAIAAEPDGIAFMGHPGDEATQELIDEAIAKGIIVTTQNVPLPRSEELYKGLGFGYVGQSLYGAGYLLGAESFRRAGMIEGDKAFVWGVLRMPGRGDRSQGMIDGAADLGAVVEYLEVGDDIMEEPTLAQPILAGFLANNPDTKLIMPDTNEVVHATITYLTDSPDYAADDIFVGVFDLNEAVVEGVESGYIDLVLDQQPYLQGYLPLLQIGLTKLYSFGGLNIDTGAGMVDSSNIAQVKELAMIGIR
jgi:simple sugar transport system substrate-binding protein